MVEFVDKPEEEIDPFDQYFEENIVPLVEEENKIKSKYRSMFWGYLFSVLFLMSVNVLIVLFISLMRHTPLSWEQLLLVNAAFAMLIYIPIYKYNKMPRNDIFDVFLKFYGNWKHSQNTEVKLVHSPIIPQHEGVGASHDIIGDFNGTTIEIRDTFYTIKNKVVSSGVVIYVTFPEKFNGSFLMFERGGFYHENKFPDYELFNSKIDIPAANYFNIFTSDDEIGEKMFHSMFFENLLDLKDEFEARHLYLQAEDNYMRIYLENSELYINNYKLWSRKVDKNRFKQMNNELEKTYLFVQTVQSLMRQK